MKNDFTLVDRLHGCGVDVIELVWVGAQYESSAFTDIVDDIIDEEHFLKVFPDKSYWEFEDDAESFFLNNDLFGFLVKVGIPYICDVRFGDDGEPLGWGVTGAIRRLYTIYGSDLEDLVSKIEITYKQRFDEMITEIKNKKV